MTFSDWILRVAEAESGEMQVLRVESLAELDAGTGTRRYVFFDDAVADALLDDPLAGPGRSDGMRWVLAYRDEALAHRMLAQRRDRPELGEVALLPMNQPIDIWTSMFRLVLAGEFFVPASLLDKGAPRPCAAGTKTRRDVALTRRESEVLSLVARGMRNKTIAHELGLSEHTIKLHLHHVISKIGVRNRTQATQWYLTRTYGAER
ncbi:response regulator transcription factor [Roseibacterium sp. SDUM158017]|uniref:helix-turn-helix transcriptional regulator n=1 Tax=Roseicyclus salinarum TaxID=3036773 RepID=UPI002414FD76|nr:response regulator transcription factor [Roseibacterium sp. SDUM158017]MDG4650319.1 response regulator transcription factor [Roseibacterium sp. SDUM158017]